MLLWQSNKNGYRRSLEYNRRPGWQKSRMCMCAWGIPQDPRGGPVGTIPLWRWRGGSRDIKALPSYFLLEGCFEKGRRIEWQGSWVKRGKKYMQPCLTLCQRKDGQGIKRHGRDEISCGKRYETGFHLNIYNFLYKNVRSAIRKLLPVQITLTFSS